MIVERRSWNVGKDGVGRSLYPSTLVGEGRCEAAG